MAEETKTETPVTPVVEENDNEEYSLEVNEIPINIKDKNGVTKEYILREIMGDERDKYLNNLASKTRVGPDGKSLGLKSFDGIQANLISRCLIDKSTGRNVPEMQIQKWPAKVQGRIFKKCQSLCGLDDKAEETAKND